MSILIFSTALCASTLSNLAGHGGAMLLLPLLALWFDPKQVIGLAVFYYVTMNIARIVAFRSGIVWWAVGALTVTAVPFALLGVYAIELIDSPIWMRLAIGLFVWVFIFTEVRGKGRALEIHPGRWPLVLIGAPYGFLSGFISSGSIVRTPVMIRSGFSKEFFIATTAASSLIVNVPKVYLYNEFGFLALADPATVTALASGAVLGTYAGKRLQKKISSAQFHTMVLVILAILGSIQIATAMKDSY